MLHGTGRGHLPVAAATVIASDTAITTVAATLPPAARASAAPTTSLPAWLATRSAAV